MDVSDPDVIHTDSGGRAVRPGAAGSDPLPLPDLPPVLEARARG